MSFKHEIAAGRSRLPRRKGREKKHVSSTGVAFHHLILLCQQEILKVLYKMLRAPIVATGEGESNKQDSSNLREFQLQRN